jgi:hypothetical protein
MDSFHGETVVRERYRSGFYNLGVKDCLICRSIATNELSTMPRLTNACTVCPHADRSCGVGSGRGIAKIRHGIAQRAVDRSALVTRKPVTEQRLIDRRGTLYQPL